MITDIKIKSLTKRELIVAIDRLTRFKYTEDKYLRVFKEIILSNLIEPKFKKKDLDNFLYSDLKDYAEQILNYSIDLLCNEYSEDYSINEKLLNYENSIFFLNSDTNVLLKNKIKYNKFLSLIDNDSPVNLKWLKNLVNENYSREKTGYRFPIDKVIIVEGITEEILMPVFAEKCDYNFDKHGVQIVSAGGKNQVVKLFYTFAEQLKLPIFVLLDNDAKENYEQIKLKMREFDKIHLLNNGEFEDILPKNLIVKTLNDYLRNLNHIEDTDFEYERMVTNLEEIFKKKGFHEFKKAEFAQMVKHHIDSLSDISDEIKSIINEIKFDRSFSLQ